MTTDVGIAAPEPKPNSFSRIIGVFFSPGETFASIVRRPDFVVPLVVLFVFSLLTALPLASKIDFKDLARQTLEENPRTANLPADVQAKQVGLIGGVMKAATYSAPILSIIGTVVLAAIFFAAFKIFGGEGDFVQALAVTVYAWMPNIIRGIVSVAAILAKKSSLTVYNLQNPVASNPGYFVNPHLHPIAFAFLSSIDVFTIWTMILMIIGFAAMSRFSRAKTAAIVISLWVIKVLFAVGGGAIKALQMRSR